MDTRGRVAQRARGLTALCVRRTTGYAPDNRLRATRQLARLTTACTPHDLTRFAYATRPAARHTAGCALYTPYDRLHAARPLARRTTGRTSHDRPRESFMRVSGIPHAACSLKKRGNATVHELRAAIVLDVRRATHNDLRREVHELQRGRRLIVDKRLVGAAGLKVNQPVGFVLRILGVGIGRTRGGRIGNHFARNRYAGSYTLACRHHHM